MSVYFITARQVGMVKIGCAYTPQRRMATMQIGCPVRLVLEAMLKGFHKEERELHKRFAAHRKHGEWFELTVEIEAIIAANPVTPGATREEIRVAKAMRRQRLYSPTERLNAEKYAQAMAEMRRVRELAALEEE